MLQPEGSEDENYDTEEDVENEGFAIGTVVIPVDKVKDFIDPEAVLINNVDSYIGNYLGKYFSEKVIGGSTKPEEDDDEMEGEDAVVGGKFWKVLGTIKDKKNAIPQFLWAVMRNEETEAYFNEAMKCSVIIYDVNEDSSQERLDEIRCICDALRARVSTFLTKRIFILISSLHSWSHSKLRGDGDSFSEDDYRRRRTSPVYRELQLLERYVVASGKMTKGMLKAYVIGAGAVYGNGESPLHHWFKSAWHNAKYLQVYGDGKNIVPTIYIKDLAKIVESVVYECPKKQRYIIAVDPVLSQQDQIAKVISDELGTGRVKRTLESDIYLNRELSNFQADQIKLNLTIESTFCRDVLGIEPEAEDGFSSLIKKIATEYRSMRNLQPLKVIIIGPPGSGKSTVARQISDLYRLNHFTKKDMIQSTVELLREIAGDHSEESITGVDLEFEEGLRENAKNLLFEVDECEAEVGYINDEVFIKLVRFRLLSNQCKNQGWILDGFPENYEQANMMFLNDDYQNDNEDDIEAEDGKSSLNSRFVPDHVAMFEASDDFLIDRLLTIPSARLEDRHSEPLFPLALQEFRAKSEDYDASFQFFMDEKEILYIPIDISQDESSMMQSTVFRISNMLGKPRNYGLSVEEEEALKNGQTLEVKVLDQREKEDMAQIESIELEERRKNIQLWMEKLAKVKREEFEREEISLTPLRHYLMAHVVPTLTKGLVEVTRARPEDPLDFLAEFLFQNNPGSLNPTGESILN